MRDEGCAWPGPRCFPHSRRGAGSRPRSSGPRRGVSGDQTCSGRSGGGLGGQALPVVITTSISPSVTLRCYLEESSPGSVAMATLLTKSSLRGGDWLAQKLRGLGEDVHSDGFISQG